jgi:hypothetical protein
MLVVGTDRGVVTNSVFVFRLMYGFNTCKDSGANVSVLTVFVGVVNAFVLDVGTDCGVITNSVFVLRFLYGFNTGKDSEA